MYRDTHNGNILFHTIITTSYILLTPKPYVRME